MKKTVLFFALSLVAITTFAQSEKFVKAMEPKVLAIDTTRTPDVLKDLSAAFERIADAEKTQWLPYYYAALAQVNVGYFMMNGKLGGDEKAIDPIADKAEALLSKAEALTKDNSEIYIVKKMIASLRMMVNPMARYMQYGPVAQEALETAKRLNPNNPRVYLLEGQDKYFTPEQFGGSKADARKLFGVAMDKYNTVQLQNSIDPHWGKGTTEYFINLANK
ncbi:MAG: hypothetical protein C4329_13330 [Chitinophagaceae bacterium]